MAADGSIVIDTRVDTTGIKRGGKVISGQIAHIGNDISRQISHIGSMVKRTGATIAAAFAIGKVVSFGRECLELGSDLEEVQNVVDSVFTTMSDKVNEFARNAAMTAGISETMAKRYAGTFGAMAKSFKFSEAQAYEMSTALTQLAGDVASFYNITQDEAYTKLKAVFTGETEALKELGVVMTQTALDEFALANGIGKTTSAMTEQEKVMLRYKFVLQQLDTAAGDFIRTSDSWANQTRILKLQIDSLKATIGQGFINLFTPAIKMINILLSKLATAANAFKAFTELITGRKSSGSTGKAQAGLADSVIPTLGDSYSTAADSADNLAGATHKVADATKEAEKAAKGYLSPLDEINKYSKLQEAASDGIITPDYSGGGSISDAIGNVDYGNLAEGSTVIDQISDSVSKLAELIKAKDWEGLGKYMADGINHGLERIYAAINWDNVGPKVIPFIDAFTRTFNSLVDNIDWDLMGRTLGAGVNTIVNTLNLLITGIDWKNLGKKFAEGIAGIVHEVDWSNLGELLGNWFMVSWDIFNGMVHNLPYEDIGKAMADALNGAFKEISFAEIGDTLATGLNGAFTSLYSFAINFDWQQMVDNVASGISTFFTEFDWKGNGAKLNVFITKLLDSLLEIAETTDWEAFGQGVGEFLGEIDWLGHLKRVILIIKETIGGLFDGLEESGTAGKIAAFLGRAFLIIKIADITGIGSLVKKLIGVIGKKLISEENVSSVAKWLKELFGKGTGESGNLLEKLGNIAKRASGGFSTLASTLGPLVGTAGLIAGATFGIIELTKGIAGLTEKLQGGNGVLSTMGASINTLAGHLQQIGTISAEQADEIWKIVDSCENAGMSAEEMVNTVMQKFAEWGVSTQNVNAVLQDNNYWTGQVKDNVDLLAQSAQMLGEGMSQAAETINLSGLTTKEAINGIRESLYELSISGSEFGGTYQGVLFSLENTLPSATTAQQAMDMVIGQLKAAGVPADELVKILGKKFPQATVDVKKSAVQNLPEAQKQITTSMKTAEEDMVAATDNMRSAAETNMREVNRTTKENFGEVSAETVQKWGSSSGEVKKNLDKMKQAAAMKLAEMTETVRSYFTSMYNISTSKFEYARKKIVDEEMPNIETGVRNGTENIIRSIEGFGNRVSSILTSGIRGAGNAITRELNNIVSKVNRTIGNINGAIGGVERAFTFDFDFYNPIAKKGYRGSYRMSLPRVNSVPYLAKGAVIPPRAEFLAVLGDQKNGNNIETPEGLLRKIVREETGSHGGNTYDVAVNVAGRTLLDIVIDEAEMRQSRNGKNPFVLGGA